jgi:hypothetical protein
VPLGHGDGVVGAGVVDHDDLVGRAERGERGLEPRGLVDGEDERRDPQRRALAERPGVAQRGGFSGPAHTSSS